MIVYWYIIGLVIGFCSGYAVCRRQRGRRQSRRDTQDSGLHGTYIHVSPPRPAIEPNVGKSPKQRPSLPLSSVLRMVNENRTDLN